MLLVPLHIAGGSCSSAGVVCVLSASSGVSVPAAGDGLAPEQERILALLKARAGVDPACIRPEALRRALERRLRALGAVDFDHYRSRLEAEATEPRRLARALNAGDDDLFLGAEVAGVVRGRLELDAEQPLQCWVVDCSEGEAVYGLAMRIATLNAALEGGRDFLVHGTDTDAAALQRARAGVLDPRFAEQVPAALSGQYLLPEGAACRVLPALGRHCRFVLHEALSPPPFLGLDLISGRQLLRYLPLAEQRCLLEHWFAALKPDGLLLLGYDEALQGHEDLFDPRPLAPGLFQRRGDGRPAFPLTTAAPSRLAMTDPAVGQGRLAEPVRAVANDDPLHRPLPADPGAAAVNVAMQAMREALLLCDAEGRIQRFNRAAEQLTGWSPQEACGQPHRRVLRLLSGSGEPLPSPVDECLQSGQPVQRPDGSQQLLDRWGRRVAVSVRAQPVFAEQQLSGVAVLFEDIGPRLLLNEELAWRYSHDPVTGLLNRDEFETRLRAAVAGARAGGEPSVLCVLDIDQFRLINDVLGHAAGDELLHELAGELRVRLREGDAFARLSGDEFGILLMGLEQAGAEPLVLSLLETTRSYRFHWRDQSHSVTASMGAVAINAETESVGRVFSQADAACDAAKQAGRDCVRWMGIDTEAAHHHHEMDMVGQMGRALATDRLFLVVEDVVRVDAPAEIVYRELLVRLRGDDGRLIKPSHFIPAAERYYMMNALDRWVARHAFAKLAGLPSAGRPIVYAINVSGQSIGDPQFLSYVLAELDSSGIAPERICFEITETAAISRLTEAAHFVARLTERGCKFALDDFGVGMSGFSYLKNFPVHFLKIDGSFVRSMRDSQIDLGMVETINRIGHELGLKTIAEHVEDLEVLETLKGIGVDWAQGRGISPGKLLDELLT